MLSVNFYFVVVKRCFLKRQQLYIINHIKIRRTYETRVTSLESAFTYDFVICVSELPKTKPQMNANERRFHPLGANMFPIQPHLNKFPTPYPVTISPTTASINPASSFC